MRRREDEEKGVKMKIRLGVGRFAVEPKPK